MASIIAKLPSPPMVVNHGKKPLSSNNLQNVTVSPYSERRGRFSLFAKAAQDTSETSTSLSTFKSVRNVWDAPEDRIALFGLGFAAVVGLWASLNVVTAVDKLPLLPGVFELVGILYSSWFIYRFLLFKPDREELFLSINKWISNVLGQ